MIKREEIIGDCRLLLGDCKEILPTLGKVDACVTDPPYGMGDLLRIGGKKKWNVTASKGTNWDDSPADLTEVLALSVPSIIWGGQFFGLPVNRGWLVWDKMMGDFTTSVCELAWTNLSQPVKRVYWASAMVQREGRQHPTQKPIKVMQWCLDFLPDARTILDPFMGSGTTGVACVREGRSFIGIEIDEGYFNIACKRIRDEYARPRLALEPAPQPVQEGFEL